MYLGVVCQVRCKPVKSIHPNKISEYKLLIEEFNFTSCDLYNPLNWGVYNNKIVLLDYGITEAISHMYKLKK
jgi:hypothetical protein